MCKLSLRKVIGTLLASAILLTSSASVFAQELPTRPIRLVVLGPAGASTDIVARTLTNEMAPLVGQPVVVVSRPGCSAASAVREMNALPRDGHTMILAIGGLVWVPPQVSKAVQEKTRAAELKAMDKEAVRARLLAQGILPGSDAPSSNCGRA